MLRQPYYRFYNVLLPQHDIHRKKKHASKSVFPGTITKATTRRIDVSNSVPQTPHVAVVEEEQRPKTTGTGREAFKVDKLLHTLVHQSAEVIDSEMNARGALLRQEIASEVKQELSANHSFKRTASSDSVNSAWEYKSETKHSVDSLANFKDWNKNNIEALRRFVT
jgi:hypothetical protein